MYIVVFRNECSNESMRYKPVEDLSVRSVQSAPHSVVTAELCKIMQAVSLPSSHEMA